MSTADMDTILEGLPVIDADTCISKPHDLWTANAPAALRARLPQVKELDGAKHRVVDGDIDLGADTPVSVVRSDGRKSDGIELFGWSQDDVHVASCDMKARVRNMFGRAAWQSTDLPDKPALGSTALFLENARVLGNLLYNGVLERFPKVKVVSVESGIGCLPFPLESLDYELHETVANANGKLKMLASEYFERQVYGCFWLEKTALSKLVEDIGVENVLFETDFPHPTFLYPDDREHVTEVMGGLNPHVRKRVFQDAAAELYRIPLPA